MAKNKFVSNRFNNFSQQNSKETLNEKKTTFRYGFPSVGIKCKKFFICTKETSLSIPLLNFVVKNY
jgi:hypothetical protein